MKDAMQGRVLPALKQNRDIGVWPSLFDGFVLTNYSLKAILA